jgi:hypothetical protein
MENLRAQKPRIKTFGTLKRKVMNVSLEEEELYLNGMSCPPVSSFTLGRIHKCAKRISSVDCQDNPLRAVSRLEALMICNGEIFSYRALSDSTV